MPCCELPGRELQLHEERENWVLRVPARLMAWSAGDVWAQRAEGDVGVRWWCGEAGDEGDAEPGGDERLAGDVVGELEGDLGFHHELPVVHTWSAEASLSATRPSRSDGQRRRRWQRIVREPVSHRRAHSAAGGQVRAPPLARAGGRSCALAARSVGVTCDFGEWIRAAECV
jgi:hypothetical protein